MTTSSLSHSFIKMHGCGNTFMVVFDPVAHDKIWGNASYALLNPNTGIGADGLLVIKPRNNSEFDILMYNADGSPAGMCGNGLRCVARFLVLESIIPVKTDEISLYIWGRKVSCRLWEEGKQVTVDMGEASFAPHEVPIQNENEFIDSVLLVAGAEFHATAVSMGNPHCVIFVSEIEEIDLILYGPLIENHLLFPERTNVEFVERVNSSHLRVCVWERGVGITQACGSGACAVVVAGVKTKTCNRKVKVDLPGGSLDIEWDKDTNHVFLTGPVQEIYKGFLCPEYLKTLTMEVENQNALHI